MTDAPALPPWCSVRPLALYLRDDREFVCSRCRERHSWDSSKTDEAAMVAYLAQQHQHGATR